MLALLATDVVAGVYVSRYTDTFARRGCHTIGSGSALAVGAIHRLAFVAPHLTGEIGFAVLIAVANLGIVNTQGITIPAVIAFRAVGPVAREFAVLAVLAVHILTGIYVLRYADAFAGVRCHAIGGESARAVGAIHRLAFVTQHLTGETGFAVLIAVANLGIGHAHRLTTTAVFTLITPSFDVVSRSDIPTDDFAMSALVAAEILAGVLEPWHADTVACGHGGIPSPPTQTVVAARTVEAICIRGALNLSDRITTKRLTIHITWAIAVIPAADLAGNTGTVISPIAARGINAHKAWRTVAVIAAAWLIMALPLDTEAGLTVIVLAISVCAAHGIGVGDFAGGEDHLTFNVGANNAVGIGQGHEHATNAGVLAPLVDGFAFSGDATLAGVTRRFIDVDLDDGAGTIIGKGFALPGGIAILEVAVLKTSKLKGSLLVLGILLWGRCVQSTGTKAQRTHPKNHLRYRIQHWVVSFWQSHVHCASHCDPLCWFRANANAYYFSMLRVTHCQRQASTAVDSRPHSRTYRGNARCAFVLFNDIHAMYEQRRWRVGRTPSAGVVMW